jgi:hypothetical protein
MILVRRVRWQGGLTGELEQEGGDKDRDRCSEIWLKFWIWAYARRII